MWLELHSIKTNDSCKIVYEFLCKIVKIRFIVTPDKFARHSVSKSFLKSLCFSGGSCFKKGIIPPSVNDLGLNPRGLSVDSCSNREQFTR